MSSCATMLTLLLASHCQSFHSKTSRKDSTKKQPSKSASVSKSAKWFKYLRTKLVAIFRASVVVSLNSCTISTFRPSARKIRKSSLVSCENAWSFRSNSQSVTLVNFKVLSISRNLPSLRQMEETVNKKCRICWITRSNATMLSSLVWSNTSLRFRNNASIVPCSLWS